MAVVAADSALSDTSENPVQNKVVTSAVQSKADTATVSALSDAVNGLDDDVQGLQTSLAEKVGDVQIDGTSIVTDGVAEIPRASSDVSGVIKATSQYGTYMSNGQLRIYGATASEVKNGTHSYHSINPLRQHESTFYGLAKAAGYDEKNSTLPVGQYSEEAKTAIRTMLGLQELYEWYKNQT